MLLGVLGLQQTRLLPETVALRLREAMDGADMLLEMMEVPGLPDH